MVGCQWAWCSNDAPPLVGTQQMTDRGNSWISLVANDWKAGLKLCIPIAVIAALAIVASLTIAGFLPIVSRQAGWQVTINHQGALLIFANDEIKKAQFLLPSSQLWVNTGIRVKANQKVKVQASGSVHLAIHKLVQVSEHDLFPPFMWSGPLGLTEVQTGGKYFDRRETMICSELPLGSILGYLRTTTGTRDPGKLNPRPDGIINVKPGGHIHGDKEQDSVLWLTVNDMYLGGMDREAARKAYLGSQSTGKAYRARLRSWKKIKEAEFWDLWYYDNVGQYLINLDFDDSE